MKSVIAAAGLVAVAQAFTQPVQPPTYGALLTPDLNTPVTTGENYQITWTPKQPADGVTVSLVLCNGPSTNCVLQSSAIVEGVPAAQGSYQWSVPCGLPAGVQSTDTGYGMLIIVDGTGEFQYSTQFTVQAGASCQSGPSSSSSSPSSSPAPLNPTSIPGPPSASSSVGGDGWYGWSSASFNTSTIPAQTASSAYTTPAAVTTTQASQSTWVYQTSATATASGSIVSTPQPFTGAAAMPTAFVNAAGVIGAAALAALAF